MFLCMPLLVQSFTCPAKFLHVSIGTNFVGERSHIARFQLGDIVVTNGVLEQISETDQLIGLNRHAQGGWGRYPRKTFEQIRMVC